ncbi:MAG: hypothetical protein ACLRQ0_10770 [Monoglobales bacterium]
MKNSYASCPVCGFDFRACRQDENNEQAYMETDTKLQENAYQTEPKRSVSLVLAAIGAIAAVLLVLTIIFCKMFFENRAAQDMYNMSYTAVYDMDNTYISQKTEQLVNSAYEESQSVFVLGTAKDRIKELKHISDDYIKLSEVEQLMVEEPLKNISNIQNKIKSIDSADVQNSNRYKAIQPNIKAIQFQVDNKSWAEEKIRNLHDTNTELINSWSRNYIVNYYIGSVYYVNLYKEEALEIRLKDYEGKSHNLRLLYNFDEGGDWDHNIGELNYKLTSGKRCVMAAVVAGNYNSFEQIFLYSCKFE